MLNSIAGVSSKMLAIRSCSALVAAAWPSATGQFFRHMSANAQSDSQGREMVYAKYRVFKGKSAMSMKVIRPTWASSQFKNGNNGWQVEKEGAVFLEFAPVASASGAQQGFGERSYAWDQKLTFALKATELAALIDLDNSPSKALTLIHDPNKGSSNAGEVTKTFKISPMDKPEGSLMFSVSQTGPQKSHIAVNVSRAEYVAIATLSRYILPHLLGFDVAVEQQGEGFTL